MTADPAPRRPVPPRRRWSRARIASVGIAAAVVILFLGANIHLVAVSIASQPDCVTVAGIPAGGAAYRAAKPSC